MIAILDYGIGNVRSVLNAFRHLGIDVSLTSDPSLISKSRGLVIPGVGAFGEGMRRLEEYKIIPVIKSAVSSGMPVLGICLGFQLLMRSSKEHGEHCGLNHFPLEVERLKVDERLPHIGWGSVHIDQTANQYSHLLDGLDGESFYFVHSYCVPYKPMPYITASTIYGEQKFISSIALGNLFGVQFHPEKSGDTGLKLLKNFAEIST